MRLHVAHLSPIPIYPRNCCQINTENTFTISIPCSKYSVASLLAPGWSPNSLASYSGSSPVWLQLILPTLSTSAITGLFTVSRTILPLFLLLLHLECIPSLLNLFKFYPFPNTQLRFHLLLEAWPDLRELKSSFFWTLRALLFALVASNLLENEALF